MTERWMGELGPGQRQPRRRGGFTLIELLVVITIIAVLSSILLSEFGVIGQRSRETVTLSNMRQFGIAGLLYANDNNNRLPSRSIGPGAVKWPALLNTYIPDLRAYTSPIPDVDGKSYQVTNPTLLLSSTANYTSYIINGYNDINQANPLTSASVPPTITNISTPSNVILFGIPYPQMNQFYMDFAEGTGNNNDVVNRGAFQGTSVWVFCDGSARMLTYRSTDNMKAAPTSSGYYTDWLWLVNKANASVIQ
jgi:prepilin-type N-terminal cleavage/methylation domain-containing protein